MPNEPTTTPAVETQSQPQAEAPRKHTMNNFADLLATSLAAAKSEETTGAPVSPEPTAPAAPELPKDAPAKVDAQDPKPEAEAQDEDTEAEDGGPEDEGPEVVNGVPKDLAELAKKHGFVVKDGKVEARERVDFREAMRRKTRAIESREKALQEEQAKFVSAHKDSLELGKALMKSVSAKDWDAVARLAGYEDWNDVQRDVAESYADPHYRETQEMKRQLDQMRAATERAEQERKEAERIAAERAQESARARAVMEYKVTLSKQMSQSSDPLVKTLADDPRFVEDVFALQQEHWSPNTRTTISFDDACAMLKKTNPAWNRLHKILIQSMKEDAAAKKAVTVQKTPLKSKTEPTPTPEAPMRKRQSEMTPEETTRYFKDRLKSIAR